MINPEVALSAESTKSNYNAGTPFPHTVIDNFLDPSVIDMAAMEAELLVNNKDEHGWRFNPADEHKDQILKKGISDISKMPPIIQLICIYMNNPQFIEIIRNLTGIDDLIGDPTFTGGGLHVTESGGKLGIHHDFTDHFINGSHYYRQVNVLIYLNRRWDQTWGGNLELWKPNLSESVKTIPIEFNKGIIFNIDDAPHGHPDPLDCPKGETRRSLAFYYYSKKKTVNNFSRAWWKDGLDYT
tara:strand:+ start:471 stop:1193 length:723 start_codon:yes stop_codon:yes gene_type:complete